MEAKIVLELGYALIYLVKKTNGELLVAISNLRKEETYKPLIRIMDNMSLEATEILINSERHILEKDESFVSQIISFITKYVKEHPEVQEFMK